MSTKVTIRHGKPGTTLTAEDLARLLFEVDRAKFKRAAAWLFVTDEIRKYHITDAASALEHVTVTWNEEPKKVTP